MIKNFLVRTNRTLRYLKGRKGQTLVEYALILAFISVVAIAVLIQLGKSVTSVFTQINSQLQVATLSH